MEMATLTTRNSYFNFQNTQRTFMIASSCTLKIKLTYRTVSAAPSLPPLVSEDSLILTDEVPES